MTSKKQNNPISSLLPVDVSATLAKKRHLAALLVCTKQEGCACPPCLDRSGRSARFIEHFRHRTAGPKSLCWCGQCLDAAMARARVSPWATPGAKRRLRREGDKYLRSLQPDLWPSFALNPTDENDLRWFFNLGPKPKWISPKVQNRWKRINRCLAGGGGRLRLYLENERKHSDPLFAAIIDEDDINAMWTLRIDGCGALSRISIPKGFLGAVDRLLVHRDDKPPNSVYSPYAAERHERDRFVLRHVASCAQGLLEDEYAGYAERAEALRKNPRAWQNWPPFAVIELSAFESLCVSSGELWSDVEPSTWGDVLLMDVSKGRRLLFPQKENALRMSAEAMQRVADPKVLSDAAIMDMLSKLRVPKGHAVEGAGLTADELPEDEPGSDDYETPKERRRRERQEERAELADAVKSGAAKAWGADGHALAPAGFKADVTGQQTGNMLTTASEIAREYGLPAETARTQLEKLGCPGATQRGRRAIPVVWLQSDAGREFRSVMTRIMMAEASYQRALRRGGR